MNYKESIKETIHRLDKELREISLKIHDDPELGDQEHHAYILLTNYLEKNGFKLTYKAAGLETAFMAEFSNSHSGRRVGFCCEYDALPGIGHGCGHNLISIQGLACAVSIKTLMEQDLIQGSVVLFGTPAEESSSGKINFVKEKIVQDKVDFAMMLHPAAADDLYSKTLALDSLVVEFFGKSSHAGQAPWNGINALDALMQGFDNIGMLRQQTLPTNRIHGIIKSGGQSANVIPAYASAEFYARSLSKQDLIDLKAKMENCFKAAALATGSDLRLAWAAKGPIDDVFNNETLLSRFKHYMESEGVRYRPREEEEGNLSGSTDMGNFSYVVPAIHPTFGIYVTVPNHTREFTDAARTPEAHQYTLCAAQCLSLTAAEVLSNDDVYQHVLDDFQIRKK
ncbi:hypothetical protein G6F57_007165 [Rhizopus arrhizus]|nr:hypothetical protein G6F23_005155 [Rhizopus arrhizus]KAG1417301.1 hypothetical protein G6F58_005582 [Rhizopus delemar]KAG0762512.1 hypothetical protein G6F24_006746 [Rhizopus arrhizus]KAG0779814.1 hypothetical protein G6F22_010427 [Rhizopus arrhizus]KAG0788971.1 hypothetical protein G6F21_006831 [Rhizopus arrhizus]